MLANTRVQSRFSVSMIVINYNQCSVRVSVPLGAYRVQVHPHSGSLVLVSPSLTTFVDMGVRRPLVLQTTQSVRSLRTIVCMQERLRKEPQRSVHAGTFGPFFV